MRARPARLIALGALLLLAPACATGGDLPAPPPHRDPASPRAEQAPLPALPDLVREDPGLGLERTLKHEVPPPAHGHHGHHGTPAPVPDGGPHPPGSHGGHR